MSFASSLLTSPVLDCRHVSLHLTRGSLSTLIYSVKLSKIFYCSCCLWSSVHTYATTINEKRDPRSEGDWEVCTGGHRGRNGKEEMRLYYNLKIIVHVFFLWEFLKVKSVLGRMIYIRLLAKLGGIFNCCFLNRFKGTRVIAYSKAN